MKAVQINEFGDRSVVALDQVTEAHEHSESGRAQGKIIINVSV